MKRRSIACAVLLAIVISQCSFLPFMLPKLAHAAVVTIDASASTNANEHLVAGSRTVFTTDQVGYKFYVDSNGQCVYSKTTNAGGSWGSAVVVDAQTDCEAMTVWYDRWTPGDFGDYIHITTMESGSAVDHLFYNRLDVTTDTRLMGSTPVNISSSSGQVATLVSGTNGHAMTKAANGDIFVAISDASDSFIVRCSSACDQESSWTEVGTSPLDLANDFNLLMPLAGGNVLLINRSIGLNDIRSSFWNGSTWSTWSTLDANAVESSTYDVGMSATIDHTDGTIYLVYAADHNNYTVLDHDIRAASYNSGSWTPATNLLTDTTLGLHEVAIALDVNTSTIYVAYTARSTPTTATTADVYYATSTLAMSSWGAQQGPVNTTQGNLYGLDLNMMNDERLYVSWFDPVPDDVFGETLADLFPETKVTRRGTPTATVTADTNNFYTGGMFVIRESQTTRNVTNITITESGTVDGANDLDNIRLYYDLDTSAPYDCVSESYGGGESQFGSTDTNGFSAANGVSSFGGSVSITPTQAMCVYTVLDVLDSADDGNTLAISIASPPDDVLVSGGVFVTPASPVDFLTTTSIANDELTQTHYHWRNDDGNETGATSATSGTEDTPISALLQHSPRRLRVGVSNEGSTTSAATSFRLEYGEAAPTCNDVSVWTDVNDADDAWNMYDSTFVTEGSDTTDIGNGSGGVTNENTTLLTPNGGQRDQTSQTGALTLTGSNYVELEYSIVAATSSTQGMTYCFRVTDAGTPLPTYVNYPAATVSADVVVGTIGSQVSSLSIPSVDQYVGGAFTVRESISSRDITSITITETGTVDGSTGLENVAIFYDLDTSSPYNCASESYSGTEAQFGSTDIDGFSGANGSSTFTGSTTITTTQAACFYVVVDVTSAAESGETIDIEITGGGNDVVVTGGASITPLSAIALTGSTTLAGAVVEQTHYHWRNDDGNETGATSATGGIEDTPLDGYQLESPVRLRFGLTNTGAATSSTQYPTLEFGAKITTCSAVAVWTNVGVTADDWDMSPSANITEGANTTDIPTANGGVSDPALKTFISTNGGLRDTTASTSPITIGPSEYVEVEFSVASSDLALYDTTYCFRLSNGSAPLGGYSQYAEIATSPKRDFFVQRGVANVSGTSTRLVAGVDYVAPQSTSSAFVRITNTHHTGAGRTLAGGGSQNADDTTAYITAATNLLSGFTISRPPAAINDTMVAWELVEFIGDPGTDNEMIVRGVGTVSLSTSALTASGTALSVSDDADVVVYITGVENRNTGRNTFYSQQVTSAWNSVANVPNFTRGANGSTAVNVSYAVVEYTGINWNVQRIEHTYATTTSVETESITPVNSLSRTFIHTQKRMDALGNVNSFGHEVWLSSIGAVSFQLDSAATSPSGHTSVVWVIENMQTSNGRMKVQRSNGSTSGGTEPVTVSVSIFTDIEDIANASIFANSRAVGANTTFPGVLTAATIATTTSYQLLRSEASNLMTYRTEIVEWPISGLAIRQNYYRFYVDNDALLPTDPWPAGGTDLGENTSVTEFDEPPGDGDHVRLRMTVRVANANLPAGLYDFKLQYGLRVTTCSAIASWNDVGDVSSGAIWRAFDAPGVTNGTALSTNPPNGGDLLISVADVAGSYVENPPSPGNPFSTPPENDIEYDWHIVHNGALERSVYCFRMTRSDGEPLDGYLNYPQLRTAGYTPALTAWRWYDDTENETPTAALSAEMTAPTEIQNQNELALRVTLSELKNVDGLDVKFKVQYDETPLFSNPRDVVATSSCTASSTWCYAEAAADDNDLITTALLSATDACTSGVGDGCGTHNTSGAVVTGDTHEQGADREYAFYLRPVVQRAGAVYYFRLVELPDDIPVILNASSSYPTLVAESPTLAFTVSGLPSGTTTAGITIDASSTASVISFGSLPLNTNYHAGHRMSLTTNATEGYRVLMFARQQLLNSYGTAIASVTGTNAAPLSWAGGCGGGSTGCVGYHTTDATLFGGSTRFAPLDSFAGLESAPQEVMYNSLPATDIHDIVYRIRVNELQPAGTYETEIVYIAVPTY